MLTEIYGSYISFFNCSSNASINNDYGSGSLRGGHFMWYKYDYGYLANCTANLTLSNTSSATTFYPEYYNCYYSSTFYY